jgi:ribosomal protein S18 acetylase RimI-like enzyme
MIRNATEDDVYALVTLAFAMHGESRFSVLSFDADKLTILFINLLASEDGCLFVAEKNGEIVGGFAGWVAEHYFSRDKIASDFGLFIKPEHRGGMTAPKLLRAFVAWAKSKGARMTQAGISTGVNIESSRKLYEAIGFHEVGSLFEYKGDQ